MKKTEDMFEVLKRDVEIPDIVMKKAEGAFAKIQEEAKNQEKVKITPLSSKKKRKKLPTKRLFLVAAAVMLGAGGVTAGAAAYMRWSKTASEGMLASEETQKKMEETKLTVPVNKSDTQNGVTVTVSQTIVDSYYAHIIFKVEGYDAGEGKQSFFETDTVVVDGYDPMEDPYDEKRYFGSGGDWYDGVTMGEDGRAVRISDGKPLDEIEDYQENYRLEDGSYEYRLTLTHTADKDYFMGKPIHIELHNLGTAEKADLTNVTEASWSFDWVLEGSPEKKEYDLNAPIGDTGVTVKHVEISPISLSVTYDFPKKIYNKMDNSSGMLFFPDGVRLKDGTELKTIYLGPGTNGYISENEYFIAFPVDRILDTDEIDALLVRKGADGGERYTISLEG